MRTNSYEKGLPDRIVNTDVGERRLLGHCSSSSCEIAFAKAAVREGPFMAGLRPTLSCLRASVPHLLAAIGLGSCQ